MVLPSDHGGRIHPFWSERGPLSLWTSPETGCLNRRIGIAIEGIFMHCSGFSEGKGGILGCKTSLPLPIAQGQSNLDLLIPVPQDSLLPSVTKELMGANNFRQCDK